MKIMVLFHRAKIPFAMPKPLMCLWSAFALAIKLLHQNLGGKVAKFDGEYVVGCQTYRWGDDDIVLNAWHQNQFLTLLAKAKSTAHNAFCKNAAVFYCQQAITCNRTPNLAIRWLRNWLVWKALVSFQTNCWPLYKLTWANPMQTRNWLQWFPSFSA